MRVFSDDGIPGDPRAKMKGLPPQEIITMVNSIGDKLKDSLKKNTKGNSAVIISMNKNSFSRRRPDSLPDRFEEKVDIRGNRIFQYLYGVDSLQDSLKLAEITKAYSNTLKEEKLNVPFSVI